MLVDVWSFRSINDGGVIELWDLDLNLDLGFRRNEDLITRLRLEIKSKKEENNLEKYTYSNDEKCEHVQIPLNGND